ncbi:Xaa-Pro dipeptidase [Porticoccaceae bacterium]|nr:Xaa-Pro dipeptidase [Porticoccaceae bacterium]MDC1513635.1 Xaa-Pro dipeptidase [Porticoccaceae bacterium]
MTQEQQSTANMATLYSEHIKEKIIRFQAILHDTSFDNLIIDSGDERLPFQDDLAYPFKANPYFKEWIPLNKRSGCYLQITISTEKPRLYLLCSDDIWHSERQALPAGFDSELEIIEYGDLADIQSALLPNSGKTTLISEFNTLKIADDCHNNKALLQAIDYQRKTKTPYEHACIREANIQAVPAHRAAYEAFMAGASELHIAAAYLNACSSSENDMPYSIIAGINENAGILHNFRFNKKAPEAPRSFLIDAGVDVHGYASDITRTYAFDQRGEFSAMIECMDSKQQELVAAMAIDQSPVDLYRLSHLMCAEILIEFGVLRGSIDEVMAHRLTEAFCPHGPGHHLGCCVHDKGNRYSNSSGEVIPPPPEYPKLRSTAPMVANQVHTIEPGLYFIPALLKKLKGTKAAKQVNWSRVDDFLPYGGIRIEDNIILHANGELENLTRDAFKIRRSQTNILALRSLETYG